MVPGPQRAQGRLDEEWPSDRGLSMRVWADELRLPAAALGICVGGGPLATQPLCGGGGARRTRRGGGGQAVLRLLARREAGRGWGHGAGTHLTGRFAAGFR